MRLLRLVPSPLLALALCPGLVGCFAISHVNRDSDHRPDTTTGMAATILYPGQTAPRVNLPPPGEPGGATTGSALPGARGAAGAAPGARSSTGSGVGGSSGSGGMLIGGSSIEATGHTEVHQDPLWLKPVLVPFAIAAYPFQKAWQAVRGGDGPAAGAPQLPTAPRVTAQAAREQAELDQMRQELATRPAGAAPAEPAPPPAYAAAPARPAARSIADELAALRSARGRRAGAPRDATSQSVAPTAAGIPAAAPAPAAPAVAPGRALDRDGDGRPDHWIELEGGRPARERFDDDGDGVVERSVFLDPASGQPARVEEDLNRDGRVDSWSEYGGGELVRRRVDSTGSGVVDAWTFYRGGVPFRHEQDTNGDGFRDRIGHYENGKLAREAQDLDGDGHPDRIARFDATGEMVELDEDADGNGVIDQRSFYRGGKLERRELLTESAVRALEEETLAPPAPLSDAGGAAPGAPPPGS
jgi:hypothetical protein